MLDAMFWNCMDNCQIVTFNEKFGVINTSFTHEYMSFVVPTWNLLNIKTQYAKLVL